MFARTCFVQDSVIRAQAETVAMASKLLLKCTEEKKGEKQRKRLLLHLQRCTDTKQLQGLVLSVCLSIKAREVHR